MTTHHIGSGTSRSARAHVHIAVVDPDGRVNGFAKYLPLRWSVQHHNTLYSVSDPDLLVLGSATPELARAAHLIYPDTAIIGVVDAEAPDMLFVDVLTAGADTCVRAGASAVLAGRLIASHRRAY